MKQGKSNAYIVLERADCVLSLGALGKGLWQVRKSLCRLVESRKVTVCEVASRNGSVALFCRVCRFCVRAL